jgi:hypothetical protein
MASLKKVSNKIPSFDSTIKNSTSLQATGGGVGTNI